MALDVIVASTDRDLTTTASLRALALGASATSTAYDARFSALIRAASRWAESYIGQPLTVQTYRETVPGFGRRSLMLSRTPIRAVKAIYDATSTDDATQILTSEFLVEDREAGLLARDQGFPWTVPLQARMLGWDAIPLDVAPMPGQERRTFLVDYVAGHTYGGLETSSPNWSTEAGTTSTERTLPEDLELGVGLRALLTYQGGDQEGVDSEKLGDLSVTYGNVRSSGPDNLTPAQELLAPYRRIY